MAKKLTTEEFVEKAEEVHGGRYDYSASKYRGWDSPITILCNKHGEFTKNKAGSHIKNHRGKGIGCPKCHREQYTKDRSKTTEQFIAESREKYGNKFDYSETVYKGRRKKLTIRCLLHGAFEITAQSHLGGSKGGCKTCAVENRRYDNSKFIEQAKNVHGAKYNYALAEYRNSYDKVKIICEEHGQFEQQPCSHLSGHGCQKCGKIRVAEKQTLTTEDFIKRAMNIHGDKYDYSKVEYKKTHDKVEIMCHKHGSFEQRPSDHVNLGHGCPRCVESKFERKMREFLDENNIKYIQGSYDFLTNEKGNKEQLDFYLPYHMVAVEINGSAFHNATRSPFKGGELKDKNYHLRKTEECEKQGIELMHYFDFEDFDLFCQMLMSKIKKNKIIGASKCRIYKPTKEEVKMFFNENHVQGHCNYSKALGLKYKNEIIQICTFSKVGETKINADWEIRRLCTKKGFGVYKGLQRIAHNFLEDGQSCSATSNRYLGNGEMYRNAGFDFIGFSAPSYWWVKLNWKTPIARNRRMCNKKNIFSHFHADLGYGKEEYDNFFEEHTEKTAMAELGYVQVYNCGTKKWLYKK